MNATGQNATIERSLAAIAARLAALYGIVQL
jgi:hypothetical protein